MLMMTLPIRRMVMHNLCGSKKRPQPRPQPGTKRRQDGKTTSVAGQASRVTVSVITAAGPLTATVDTGADSIWVGWAEFLEGGGTEFEKEDTLAQSADGSPLAVVGKGKLSFSLWGKLFNSIPVRIMQEQPSGMLLGNRFIIGGLRRSMDFGTGQGSFVLTQGKFCGSISDLKNKPTR
jgi:hypothetical protein